MSGNHLSPQKIIATVLTIKLSYILLPRDFIFTCSLYLLIPFTYFIQLSPPLPLVTTGFFLYIYDSVYVLFFRFHMQLK